MLVGMMAAGNLDPHIGLRADWADHDAAIEALLNRRVIGKAVLDVR
jgi:NADPH2:quinone reductase